MTMITIIRYFDEWARRERLEDSAGRYCRPHEAPRFEEPGWTWADHSERLAREKEELGRKQQEAKQRQEVMQNADAKVWR